MLMRVVVICHSHVWLGTLITSNLSLLCLVGNNNNQLGNIPNFAKYPCI